jgi:antitoxin (DNA-binding transcriptional repressor) of toxin-antitoxin stability system
MKRYTVAEVRRRLAEALDSAEQGHAVVIERRGVRFRLDAVPPRRRRSARRIVIEYVDPVVDSGQWSWTWQEGALRLASRRRRS